MRRRLASAVVVAAVAAVAIVAIVDAVRPTRSEPVPPLDPVAARLLADLGFRGTLVYTDPACAIRALTLPELRPAPAPEGLDVGCEISVSPDGRWVGPGGARWSPDSRLYATCRGARVSVFGASGGPAQEMHTGCAPAWRPDGTLTLARDRTVRDTAGRVLVPQAELERALRAHPTRPALLDIAELRIRDLAWLSPSLVVALIQVSFPGRPFPENAALVAGYERGRLAWERVYLGRFERLVASAGGEVLPEPPPLPYPFLTGRLRLAGPFAWSPDGRGMAVATRASVFVVDLPSERQVRIPVTARDLAWR